MRRSLLYTGAGVGLALFGALALGWAASFRPAPAPKLRVCADCLRAHLASSMLRDPLLPDRPMRARGAPFGAGIQAAPGDDAEWVSAAPAQANSAPSHAADFAGEEPCAESDPGLGGYTAWQPVGGFGDFVAPARMLKDAPKRVDLVIHFHGHELARHGLVRANVPLVLFGITRANGGAYRNELAGPHALDRILAAFGEAFDRETGEQPQVRHLAITSWSGGYEAVSVLLEQSDGAQDRVDAVALFDGPHTARTVETARLQLEPFAKFARRALRGERFMFLSHTSIIPPGYASTTEANHRLLQLLARRPLKVSRDDGGAHLIDAFSEGALHERGYAGGGKLDHCAQMRLYPMLLRALERRWHPGVHG